LQLLFGTGEVSNDPKINFDLSTGAISSQDADIDDALIVAVGNDWLRIGATITTASTILSPRFALIKSATDTRNQTNSWTAGEGLYIWGVQVEKGATASSYIRTTTGAASRLADQLSIPVAGNVPSGDMTIHAKVSVTPDDATGSNRFVYRVEALYQAILGLVSPTGALLIRQGSTAPAVAAVGSKGESFGFSHVFNYTDNVLTGYLGESLSFSTSAGTISHADNTGIVGIGNSVPLGLEQLYGHIKHLKIYGEALTAAEVAQL
jgi:hypothetical protein